MKDTAEDYKLNLFINNKLIPLKPFLRNFVKQIILAMVAQRYHLKMQSNAKVEPEPLVTLRPKFGMMMEKERR